MSDEMPSNVPLHKNKAFIKAHCLECGSSICDECAVEPVSLTRPHQAAYEAFRNARPSMHAKEIVRVDAALMPPSLNAGDLMDALGFFDELVENVKSGLRFTPNPILIGSTARTIAETLRRKLGLQPKPLSLNQIVSLNQLAAQYHADNQHWWHDPATGVKLERNKHEMLMLIVSEIAEAMEGERKDLMDDKIKHRKAAEVELADVFIRMMDYAGAYSFDLDTNMRAVMVKRMLPENKGEALMKITRAITQAATAEYYGKRDWVVRNFCEALKNIFMYCELHGYDLMGAVEEKRAYNATRPDHKPKARLAPNGKKF